MNDKLWTPPKPDLVKPPARGFESHHSVPGDWLFKVLPDWTDYPWNLETSDYISPPSSLRTRGKDTGTRYHAVIVNTPDVQNFKEGRLVTSVRAGPYGTNVFYATLGIKPDHSYEIMQAVATNNTVWKQYRITWWYAYDYQNSPSTRILIERWDDPNWTTLSETDHDPIAGTQNLASITFRGNQYDWSWLDNTAIYIPAA